jgi:hypothetical protein
MKTVALAALAALVLTAAASSLPSSSPQEDDAEMVMSPRQAAQCEAEGGCGIFTRAFIRELQRRAFEAGTKACKSGKET